MNLKRIFVLASLLLLCAGAAAEAISREEARLKAQAFFAGRPAKSGAPEREVKLVSEQGRLRIFQRDGGGFVVISSEEAADAAVLGYSEGGEFRRDNVPPAMLSWLKALDSHVEACAQRGPDGRAGLKAQEGKLLTTASWSQQSPYNGLCPELAPVGCAPLAMGIIMRYYQWPDAGTGTLESYSYEDIHKKTHSVTGYALGHKYDWENMPLSGVTKDNASGIPQLLLDCGVMTRAWYSYSDNGTVTFTSKMLPALKEHMKFDASGMFRYLQYSDAEEWVAAVAAEIDSSRPVLYCGQDPDTEEGHAFVVDGYDSESRFHINWGWGGEQNGYFTFPAFSEYTQSHAAIFGLRKDEGGTPDACLLVKSISSASSVIEKGEEFSVDFEAVNISDCNFKGSVAVGLLDEQEELVQTVSEAIPVDSLSFGEGLKASGVKCTVTEDIKVGDALTLFFKYGDGQWQQCVYDTSESDSAFIRIADTAHLDAATSMRYDRTVRTVTLVTKAGAACTVSGGNADTRTEALEDGTLQIEISGLQEGASYTVTLDDGKETFTFKLLL